MSELLLATESDESSGGLGPVVVLVPLVLAIGFSSGRRLATPNDNGDGIGALLFLGPLVFCGCRSCTRTRNRTCWSGLSFWGCSRLSPAGPATPRGHTIRRAEMVSVRGEIPVAATAGAVAASSSSGWSVDVIPGFTSPVADSPHHPGTPTGSSIISRNNSQGGTWTNCCRSLWNPTSPLDRRAVRSKPQTSRCPRRSR